MGNETAKETLNPVIVGENMNSQTANEILNDILGGQNENVTFEAVMGGEFEQVTLNVPETENNEHRHKVTTSIGVPPPPHNSPHLDATKPGCAAKTCEKTGEKPCKTKRGDEGANNCGVKCEKKAPKSTLPPLQVPHMAQAKPEEMTTVEKQAAEIADLKRLLEDAHQQIIAQRTALKDKTTTIESLSEEIRATRKLRESFKKIGHSIIDACEKMTPGGRAGVPVDPPTLL